MYSGLKIGIKPDNSELRELIKKFMNQDFDTLSSY